MFNQHRLMSLCIHTVWTIIIGYSFDSQWSKITSDIDQIKMCRIKVHAEAHLL